MSSWGAADSWDNADDKWSAAPAEEKAADGWAASGDGWGASPAEEKPADAWGAAAEEKPADAWGGGGGDPWTASAKDEGANAWKSGGDDAWKSGGDSWGAGASAGPTPNAKAFWEAQEWNKSNGTLSKKEEWELEQDEASFFAPDHVVTQGIDFDMYDSVPVEIKGGKAENIPALSTFAEIYTAFKEMVSEALIQNVRLCRYEKPTPVQKYAIPVGLAGRDVMCCAQTGSGKTAAFLMPIIGRMMKIHESPVGNLDAPYEGKCEPDTLVMAPTRELVMQIHDEALKFCHRTPYRTCRVYGGEKPNIQLEQLAKGCDLMVATPGRLQDFINRGVVSVEKVFVLVLDEADRMLDMGFEKQIREIVESHGMPGKDSRQTMMFSATFAEECQRMAQDFLYDYIWIGVGVVGGACTSVTQKFVQVEPAEKYAKLIEVLDEFFLNRTPEDRCLVFVNAKDTAKWLDEQLFDKAFDTGALHGNLDQHEREENLKKFRNGQIDVLIATDVASRGLDIEKVHTVVNYDLPTEIEGYVHRIGRSGRIGNRGNAVSFVSQFGENVSMLESLQKIVKDAEQDCPDWIANVASGQASGGGGGSNDGWSNWSKPQDAREKWSKEGDADWSSWSAGGESKW